jgi:hypothetical protein
MTPSKRCSSKWLGTVALVANICLACGSSDGDGKAGSGGGGGDGGAEGSGGTGTGGASGCQTGQTRCGQNDTIETCEGGSWATGTQCSGTTPLCTNGTCAAVRLHGGFVSVGGSSEFNSVRLVDQGFDELPTKCGSVNGDTVCLKGALRP